jgi:hypothetical protein
MVKYSNTIKLFKNGTDNLLTISSLFPNPVQHELNVALTAEKGRLVYNITAMNGQQVWRKEEDLQFNGNYIRKLNISGIPPGNYILTLLNGTEKTSKKFIKSKE